MDNMIGKRVAEIRKNAGLNQTDFASSLTMGQSALAMIETGKRDLTEKNARLICLTYNVNYDWLVNGKGEMFLPAIDEEMNYVSELLEDVDNPLYEIIKSIMKTYLELDEKQKDMVKSFAKNLKENIKESQD